MALTSGMAISWSSPVLAILQDETKLDDNPFGRVIDDEESSWIGSLLALGAAFGPFLSAILADKLGRKMTLMVLAVPFIGSYFLLAFAKVVSLYYIGRVIMGAVLGGVFTVIPMYIGEVAQDNNRGMLSSSFNLLVCAGIMLSYLIGPYLSITVFNIVCAILPAASLILTIFLVPESPYYLIGKGNLDSATGALKRLRGTSDVSISKEMESMRDEMERSSEGHFMDLFRSRGLIKALIISISLVSFQQLSGINVILFNAQTIFEATGSDLSSAISAMIIGGVQFGSGFVTPIVVDKLGRRALLILSGIGMCVAEVPLGLYFYLSDETDTDVGVISWLPVLTLVLYIILYNCGFGPLPWAVMGELFPSNVKSAASSMTASICWLLGFILTKFFTSVSDAIHLWGSFWLFAGLCVVAAVFTMVYVPETKGKSLQEIQNILSGEEDRSAKK